MNELTIVEPEVLKKLARSMPPVAIGLRETLNLFSRVKGFEDIERFFLKGAGLAANTYRSYLASVRQFYFFAGGKHPMQVTPADIEAFYDKLLEDGTSRKTARLRIAGLKKFFAGIVRVAPGYTSVFHGKVMDEKLRKKLNKVPRGNGTKAALTVAEFNTLLAWIETKPGLEWQENRAMIFMLATSGLRAFELCSLKWADLDLEGTTWSARFLGKGGKSAVQELYTPAVEDARVCFRAQFKQDPRPTDYLFYSIPRPGQKVNPMTPHLLWTRIAQVGQAAREEGILTREAVQFSPHLFRRTFATMLYKSGMQVKAIQLLTRHANINTLTTHYIDDRESSSPYLEKALAAV